MPWPRADARLKASDEVIIQARIYRRIASYMRIIINCIALSYYQQALNVLSRDDPGKSLDLLKDRAWLCYLWQECGIQGYD